jgi:hypothetical protein
MLARARQKSRRARNLDDQTIGVIVGILDGWAGRLSWAALIDEIEARLHSRYTRQALHKHERIRRAFSLRRDTGADELEPKRIVKGSLERRKDQERIARLTAENHRLEAENSRLLEQFVRWLYNAHARGLDQAFLNQPLPPVQRDRTEPQR